MVSFPERKILPFYCIILLFTVIYIAKGILFEQKISLENLLKSLTFGGTVISNGWYLQLQLLLYLLYFATFYVIKNNKLHIIFILLECLLIFMCMYSLGYESTWYESIFAFPVGMIWCSQENRIAKLFERKTVSIICALSEFVIVSIAFIVSHNAIIELILKMISAVFFTTFVATATKFIPVQNRLFNFLGKYSIEIYVVQGIFLTLFHSEVIYLTNPYIYIIAVFISTFCASIILHPITRKIYSLARNH